MSLSSPEPPTRAPHSADRPASRSIADLVSKVVAKAKEWIFGPPELAAPAGGSPPPRRRWGLAAGAGLPGVDPGELLRPPEGFAVSVVQLRGPLLPEWREELSITGAELLEHLGNLGYSARIEPPTAVESVAELPFVDFVRPYRVSDTIHPEHLVAEYVEAPEEETTWELLVHPRQEVSPVVNLLEARHERIDLWTDQKLRFTTARAEIVRGVAGLREVAMIYEYFPPSLSNDRARVLTRIDSKNSPTTSVLSETGANQLIGVADGGLDANHPDFEGRIIKLIPRSNDSSDRDGHGTHVAGSILSSGAASNGAFRGVAPEAQLFFQSITDATGKLTGVDPSFADVLQEAYVAGVRIHNNSWGTEAGSAYLANSRELDGFVAEHPDMLVVVAAGNSGTAMQPPNVRKQRRNVPPGYVELFSVESPGTAKNALTVGASRSDRAPSPQAKQPTTFGGWWPECFPEPPISSEAISGDAEAMAAISSRGPCINQTRFKPDLVAPGTFILSARSSTAPAPGRFWALHDNDHYAFDGGTSMAAAIVSGCATLVRQYLIDKRNHHPSAALLKAILINGARWLDGADAVDGNAKPPNYHQGFGCVSLADSIPNTDAPSLGLEFSDSWDTDECAVVQTESGQRFTFEIDGKLPVRLCLAWTDPVGGDVQNQLALELAHPITKRKWYGNDDRPGPVRPDASDINNNVQVIRIDDAPAGTYVVSVSGYSLTFPPQRFALATTSSFATGITSVGSFDRRRR